MAEGSRPRLPQGIGNVNNKPAYLSKEGLEKLREELDELVNVRRAEVATRIHDARTAHFRADGSSADARTEPGGATMVLSAPVASHGKDHAQ